MCLAFCVFRVSKVFDNVVSVALGAVVIQGVVLMCVAFNGLMI